MNDMLVQKIQSLQRCVFRARDIYNRHRDNFLNNFDAQDAAVLNILRSCELAIDLANYLIRRDKLGIPTTSADSFDLLYRNGKIESAMAERLKAMVGFRNITVHEYKRIDYDIVARVIEMDLDELVLFADRVRELS